MKIIVIFSQFVQDRDLFCMLDYNYPAAINNLNITDNKMCLRQDILKFSSLNVKKQIYVAFLTWLFAFHSVFSLV